MFMVTNCGGETGPKEVPVEGDRENKMEMDRKMEWDGWIVV